MKNSIKWKPYNEPVRTGVWLTLDEKTGVERVAVLMGEGGATYAEWWDLYWWQDYIRPREPWGGDIRPLGRPDSIRTANDLRALRIKDITGEYLLDEEGMNQLSAQDPRLPEIILELRPDLAVGRAFIESLIKSDDRKKRELGIKLLPRMQRIQAEVAGVVTDKGGRGGANPAR